jgi:hypothetical protein
MVFEMFNFGKKLLIAPMETASFFVIARKAPNKSFAWIAITKKI